MAYIKLISHTPKIMGKNMASDRLARAKRVQLLREMTKLSRRQFAKKTGIAHSTMQHWEDGLAHTLPEKSVMRLLKALVNLGIHCSYDWLIYGKKGQEPEYIQSLNISSSPDVSSHPDQKLQMTQIQEELSLFLKQSQNAIDYRVNDDAMEPRFIINEIVAGFCSYGKDIANLIGFDCIVIIQGGDKYLRKILKGDIEGCYHLTHTNINTHTPKPFFYNVELVSAAPVIWARRQPPLF